MKLSLLVFLWFASVQLSAQKGKEIFSFSNYIRKELTLLPAETSVALSLPFNKIIVKDARFDTSAILINSDRYFVFHSMESSMEQYFSQSLGLKPNADTGRQLVVFIKKLWCTNQFQLLNADQQNRFKERENWLGGLLFKAECFYKTDNSFYPVFRFDTTLSTDVIRVHKDAPDLVDICLRGMVEKIVALQNKNLAARSNKMSLAEVTKYNNDRFDLPVLTDSVIKKGVYLSFNDFKANNPAYTFYTVQKGKLSDEIYITEPGANETLLQKAWGYCDGSYLFVKSAGNYFQLIRYGHSFYLKGAKGIYRNFNPTMGEMLGGALVGPDVRTAIDGSISGHNPRMIVIYRPYQLDMETGLIY